MSRSFSELDKKIINSLVNLDSRKGLNVLGNIIEEYLDDYYYISVPNSNNVSVMLENHYLNKIDLNNLNSYISDLLLTIVVLFDDLVKDRFIYFTGSYQFNSLGHSVVGQQYTALNIIDADLMGKIHSYTARKFFITENLKDFIENGYKSKEEIKQENDLKLANKQLVYTRVALVITFLGLIASILVPLISTTSITLGDETVNISSEKATVDYIDNKFDKNRSEFEAYQKSQSDMIEALETRFNDEAIAIKSEHKSDVNMKNDQLKMIFDRIDKHEKDIKKILSIQEIEKNKHNKLLKSDS
ncbi:hypothetical protein [Vibrio vulnificus]|uniref:hypothetical protein n=1 Tax=Vibrio vulnificus TaxID=672 RepID=UPI00307F3E8D